MTSNGIYPGICAATVIQVTVLSRNNTIVSRLQDMMYLSDDAPNALSYPFHHSFLSVSEGNSPNRRR